MIYEILGTVQNLLHNEAGANAFLKFKKGSAPPKETGRNVETPQTVIVKKVLTPPCERNQLHDWPKGQLLCTNVGVLGCFPWKIFKVRSSQSQSE